MSNPVHDAIGKSLAQGNVAVAKAIGIIIGFKHRDDLPVPFYARKIDEQSDDVDQPLGRRVDHNSIKMILPSQDPAWSGASGFSGTWAIWPTYSGQGRQPHCGDRVEYPIGSSEWYYLDGNTISLNNGWSYELTAVQPHTQSLGEKEAGA